MSRTGPYTFLFVGDLQPALPKVLPDISRYQLLVCPYRPLEIGSMVFLVNVLDAPCTVPFFPRCVTSPPVVTYYSDVWGQVVAANTLSEREIEFVVQNWNAEARVRSAFIRVPRLPGLAVARDIWRSLSAQLSRELDDSPKDEASKQPQTTEAGLEEPAKWNDLFFVWLPENAEGEEPRGQFKEIEIGPPS